MTAPAPMATDPAAPPPLPHPATVRLPDRYKGFRIAATVVITLALVAAAIAVYRLIPIHIPGLVAQEIGVPAVILVIAVLLLRPWGAGRTLRREDALVVGLVSGPLPVGTGRIVVERKRFQAPGDTANIHFELRYEGEGGTQVLYRHQADPIALRRTAKAVCRLGGWDLVWVDPEGEEVRPLAELDRPFAARVAAGEDGDDGTVTADPVALRPRASGGIELPTARLPALRWFLLTVLPMTAAGIGIAILRRSLPGVPVATRLLALGAVGLVAGVLIFVALETFGQPLTVDPGGIEVATRMFGLTLGRRRFSTSALESVYLEQGHIFYYLAFAGDGFHYPAGRFGTLGEAVEARRAVAAALLGKAPSGIGVAAEGGDR